MAYAGLDAEDYDRVYSDKDLLLRILKIFKPYRRSMLYIAVFLVFTSITYGILPILTYILINQVENKTSSFFIVVIVTILAILMLRSLSFVFNFINRSRLTKVIAKLTFDLRFQSNYAVLIQDLSFFDKFPTGKIASRISNDGQKFGEMVNLSINSISSVLILIVTFIPMFNIGGNISFIVLMLLPFFLLLTMVFRKLVRKQSLLGQRSLALVNAFVQETMSGIQIAKTFSQEEKLFSEFQTINKQNYKVSTKKEFSMNMLWPSLNIVIYILFSILVYIGGQAITDGFIEIDGWYLIFQSFGLLVDPLLQLVTFWPQFQDGLSAAERIFSLQDAELDIIDGDYVFDNLKGKIEFKNLNFNYIPDAPVLENFNLTIEPGESIAIVGHTGAGKTTVARLLLRLYEFQSDNDTLLIDGKSIRDLKLAEFRRKVGYIGQEPFLWNDTIENNIKYGLVDATREEVLSVLEQSGGVDWIQSLDNGLDTQIMERGKLLSMGQKQLLIFARVLMQNPSILILDEATASIDPFTETKILETMEKAMEGRTSIIIAHRLVTVRHVDRIIVLDHGKIIEEGNHEALMAKKGYYSELYDTYFRHQSYEFLEDMSRKKAEFKVEEN